MTHKVCNSLEHTPWLEDKGGQGHFMQVHANPELAQERDQDIPRFVIENFGSLGSLPSGGLSFDDDEGDDDDDDVDP